VTSAYSSNHVLIIYVGVVHLTTLSKGAAEDDLHEYVDLLFTRSK